MGEASLSKEQEEVKGGFTADPFRTLPVDRFSNYAELAESLATMLQGTDAVKIVTLSLEMPSERWKLFRALQYASRSEDILWAQPMSRLRDKKMRFRVIRGLPLALPEGAGAIDALKVSKTTDPSALAKAILWKVNQCQGFARLWSAGQEPEAVTLLALEKLQQMAWREISFTVQSDPDQTEVWVHDVDTRKRGRPLWELFPTVDDAGNETVEDVAKRVAAFFEAPSTHPYVDLTSSSAVSIVEILAALPPELSAASLIAPRVRGIRGPGFRARIARDFPAGADPGGAEPSAKTLVSGKTDPGKLAGFLKAQRAPQGNSDDVQQGQSDIVLGAIGPEAVAKAFLAVEATKWRVNQEIAFTVRALSSGEFVFTISFL